ncbi:MAG: hypothetical protein ACI8TQ_001336 [Planctomycetota bacterium]|jgi:hypothetical protein
MTSRPGSHLLISKTMNITQSTFLALSLLAATSSAQTPATADAIVPCTQPAPQGSLVAQATLPLTYVDDGNEVVMEMESQAPIGNWVAETIVPGFAGDSYFRWDGPDLFNTPGVDILTYNFAVNTAGTYLIRLRVQTNDPDPSEENDCWARVDGGTWRKLFLNIGSGGVGVWSFNARYESTNDFPTHVLSAGAHTFEISGRSKNFKIDRIHVLPIGVFFANLGDPQSDVQRSRPVIGSAMIVEVDDPRDFSGLTPGVALTGWFIGQTGPGYPCGLPTVFGESLIQGPGKVFKIGPFKTWMGPMQPNVHGVFIPNDVSLVGARVISQALLFETDNFVLSEGLELNIGDM